MEIARTSREFFIPVPPKLGKTFNISVANNGIKELLEGAYADHSRRQEEQLERREKWKARYKVATKRKHRRSKR